MSELRDELRDHDEIDRLDGVSSVEITVRFQARANHDVASVSCNVYRTRRPKRDEAKRAVVVRRLPDDPSAPPYEDR